MLKENEQSHLRISQYTYFQSFQIHQPAIMEAKLFTRYSLLFTRKLLLFACYSLLFTCYSLNFTRYSLHCTRYSLLVTFYSSFFTRYSLVLTCYLLLLTGYLLHFILTALPYIHNVHIILCVSCGKRKYKPYWMLFFGRSILSDMM